MSKDYKAERELKMKKTVNKEMMELEKLCEWRDDIAVNNYLIGEINRIKEVWGMTQVYINVIEKARNMIKSLKKKSDLYEGAHEIQHNLKWAMDEERIIFKNPDSSIADFAGLLDDLYGRDDEEDSSDLYWFAVHIIGLYTNPSKEDFEKEIKDEINSVMASDDKWSTHDQLLKDLNGMLNNLDNYEYREKAVYDSPTDLAQEIIDEYIKTNRRIRIRLEEMGYDETYVLNSLERLCDCKDRVFHDGLFDFAFEVMDSNEQLAFDDYEELTKIIVDRYIEDKENRKINEELAKIFLDEDIMNKENYKKEVEP